jgi:hypothetical protein
MPIKVKVLFTLGRASKPSTPCNRHPRSASRHRVSVFRKPFGVDFSFCGWACVSWRVKLRWVHARAAPIWPMNGSTGQGTRGRKAGAAIPAVGLGRTTEKQEQPRYKKAFLLNFLFKPSSADSSPATTCQSDQSPQPSEAVLWVRPAAFRPLFLPGIWIHAPYPPLPSQMRPRSHSLPSPDPLPQLQAVRAAHPDQFVKSTAESSHSLSHAAVNSSSLSHRIRLPTHSQPHRAIVPRQLNNRPPLATLRINSPSLHSSHPFLFGRPDTTPWNCPQPIKLGLPGAVYQRPPSLLAHQHRHPAARLFPSGPSLLPPDTRLRSVEGIRATRSLSRWRSHCCATLRTLDYDHHRDASRERELLRPPLAFRSDQTDPLSDVSLSCLLPPGTDVTSSSPKPGVCALSST